MPDTWCLIFSDGTGQRGVRNDSSVRNTNIFQMFAAAEDKPYLETFYDPGLGAPAEGSWAWTRTARNLWSKATGWGITANITDCYEALMLKWKPGMKIGLFGFWSMVVFLGVLTIGFIYEWKKGALEWE